MTLPSNEGPLCFATALAFPAPESGEVPNPPKARLMRFTLRPSLYFPRSSEEHEMIDADVLLHELTHVQQKEERPITFFSSQKDANNLAYRDELEAYHVGALVRSRMEGVEIDAADQSNDPYLQMSVEAIRRRNCKDPNEPFKPSEELAKDLTAHGYHKDRILAARLDFIGAVKQFKKLQPQRRRPKKNKKRK